MRCFLLLCLFTSFFLEAADCRDYFTRGMKSWKFWAPPGCVVKFRHSKEEGATKKGALEIVVGAGNPMGKTAVFTNHYPVVSGRSYWKDTLLIIFCMGVRDCDSGRVFFDDFEFTEEGMK